MKKATFLTMCDLLEHHLINKRGFCRSFRFVRCESENSDTIEDIADLESIFELLFKPSRRSMGYWFGDTYKTECVELRLCILYLFREQCLEYGLYKNVSGKLRDMLCSKDTNYYIYH